MYCFAVSAQVPWHWAAGRVMAADVDVAQSESINKQDDQSKWLEMIMTAKQRK
jgi:hypothetical protein